MANQPTQPQPELPKLLVAKDVLSNFVFFANKHQDLFDAAFHNPEKVRNNIVAAQLGLDQAIELLDDLRHCFTISAASRVSFLSYKKETDMPLLDALIPPKK